MHYREFLFIFLFRTFCNFLYLQYRFVAKKPRKRTKNSAQPPVQINYRTKATGNQFLNSKVEHQTKTSSVIHQSKFLKVASLDSSLATNICKTVLKRRNQHPQLIHPDLMAQVKMKRFDFMTNSNQLMMQIRRETKRLQHCNKMLRYITSMSSNTVKSFRIMTKRIKAKPTFKSHFMKRSLAMQGSRKISTNLNSTIDRNIMSNKAMMEFNTDQTRNRQVRTDCKADTKDIIHSNQYIKQMICTSLSDKNNTELIYSKKNPHNHQLTLDQYNNTKPSRNQAPPMDKKKEMEVLHSDSQMCQNSLPRRSLRDSVYIYNEYSVFPLHTSISSPSLFDSETSQDEMSL